MTTLKTLSRVAVLLTLGFTLVAADQPAKGQQGSKGGGGSQAQSRVLLPAAGPLDGRTLVGAPDSTVRLSTWFDQPSEYFYTWGREGAALDRKTGVRSAPGQAAVTDVIGDLGPNQAWGYQLHWRTPGETTFRDGPVGRLVTPRTPGQSFRFVIEADPHLDENSNPDGYRKTLADMAAENADFCVDLGDASMVGKLAETPAAALDRNLVLRSYWDDLGGRTPFFLVLGNHDGEVGWADGKAQVTPDQARQIRRNLFPTPDPVGSSFYRGLSDTSYSFTWGDALIVILDPYNPSTKRTSAGTEWTLGRPQFDWLAQTLRASQASYKFLFIHHLVTRTSSDARGGAQAASEGEWGAKIHPLLVEAGVDAVFHGHDHFYSREVKDGVVYQLVPQPSAQGKQNVTKTAEEYGYTGGDNLPSPGFLLVSVAPLQTTVELRVPGSAKAVRSFSFQP